jgi:hypothetical protein
MKEWGEDAHWLHFVLQRIAMMHYAVTRKDKVPQICSKMIY